MADPLHAEDSTIEPRSLYDAVLLVSFGGPDGPDDVIPFLENVLRGRNVPRERMLEVAEHYYHFAGKSPIVQELMQRYLGVAVAEPAPRQIAEDAEAVPTVSATVVDSAR